MKQLKFLQFVLVLFFFGFACKKPKSEVTEVIPITPTELTVVLLTNTQATLNWVDKSTNEAGFKVERKTGNGTFGVIATTTADITTINDAGLIPNTTYTYRVYSFNNTGKSLSYSNEVTITTYTLPSITTAAISELTGVNAISGGNVTSDGGSPIIARGTVWDTNTAPTVALTSKTTDGNGVGQFTSKVDLLTKNTKYYVRAYATNAAGTAYGNEIEFTTLNIDLNLGLVTFYPFNGNANDESGNGYNGVVNGANLTTDRFNSNNKAYYFSGSNCSTYISANLNTSSITTGLTVSAWVMRVGVGCIGPRIIDFIPSAGPNLLGSLQWIWNNNNEALIISRTATSNSNTNFFNLSTKPNNTWTLWTYTCDGQNEKVYQDGLLLSTTAVNKNPILGNIVNIGRMSYPAFDAFNGKIDDVRIYNRAISLEEIVFLNKN